MKKLFVLLLILLLANAAAAETRQGVLNKLYNTVIKKVGVLDGFTMPEVLDILSDASGETVNFMYMPHLHRNRPVVNSVTNRVVGIGGVDPTTGLPTGLPNVALSPQLGGLNEFRPPSFVPEPIAEVLPKIRGVRIKLRNVTLKQLLDITALSFDKPVKYVITDFGVIFLPREENKPPLFNRVYQINPKRLNNMRPNK